MRNFVAHIALMAILQSHMWSFKINAEILLQYVFPDVIIKTELKSY